MADEKNMIDEKYTVDEKYTPEQAKKILTRMKIKNVIFKIFMVIGGIATFFMLAGFVLNLMSFKIERNISGIMWSYDDNELIGKVTVKVKGKYVVADSAFKGKIQVMSEAGEMLYDVDNMEYSYSSRYRGKQYYDVVPFDDFISFISKEYTKEDIGRQAGNFFAMDKRGKNIAILLEPKEGRRVYIAAPASDIEGALKMLDKKVPLSPYRNVWSEGGPVITYLGNGITQYIY